MENIPRRTVLSSGAAVAAIPFAGCLDMSDADSGSQKPSTDAADSGSQELSTEVDCDRAGTVTADIESGVEQPDGYESVGTVPYPDRPESLSDDSVAQFSEQYERAHLHNRLAARYGESLVQVNPSVRPEPQVAQTDGHWRVGLVSSIDFAAFDDDGRLVSTEPSPAVVVYAIDRSAIVRMEDGSPDGEQSEERFDPMPNPVEDGELLECFEQ